MVVKTTEGTKLCEIYGLSESVSVSKYLRDCERETGIAEQSFLPVLSRSNQPQKYRIEK